VRTRKHKPARAPEVAYTDNRGYAYDVRGFPIKRLGELGPPGVRVTLCRPTVPFVETLASCFTCRRLVLCFTLEDGTRSLWGMGPFDRLAHGSWLRIAGADAGQEFAEGCPRCGIAPHGTPPR
jgi:hypothetical protein